MEKNRLQQTTESSKRSIVILMGRLAEWIRMRRQIWRTRRELRRSRALFRESERRIQAGEFSGEIFITLDGVPVMPADGLTWDMPTSLTVAREAWIHWREKEDEYRR